MIDVYVYGLQATRDAHCTSNKFERSISLPEVTVSFKAGMLKWQIAAHLTAGSSLRAVGCPLVSVGKLKGTAWIPCISRILNMTMIIFVYIYIYI